MSRIVQENTLKIKKQQKGRAFRNKFADLVGNWRIKMTQPSVVQNRIHGTWRPRTALGTYMWYVSKLFEIIDEAADERLITHHLYTSSPPHLRRTLDQFYYWTVENTTVQDLSQVVCRGTRSSHDLETTARIVMVDQLWMWILDDSRLPSLFSLFARCRALTRLIR